MLLGNDAYRLAQVKAATNVQFVKNTIPAKGKKAKSNETRYACTYSNGLAA